MTPHRIVCLSCRRVMRIKRNGVTILLTSGGDGYEAYNADKYWCPNCGTTAAAGIAMHPYAEYWQKDFAERTKDVDYTVELHPAPPKAE